MMKQTSYPIHNRLPKEAKRLRLALAVLTITLVTLVGCASSPDQPGLDDMSAQQLSTKGNVEVQQGNYLNAIDYYSALVERFPYDKITEGARLQLAYALYKNQQPEQAIEVAQAFIKLYPEHKSLSYAYYVRALASFSISRDDLQKHMAKPPSEQALDSTRQTFEYFSDLASRFPKSRYFNDAMSRIVKLRDSMARYEVYVANYYFTQGDYKLAQNRAEYVTRYYPRSPTVADALAVVAKSQLETGNERKAAKTLTLIESNYPDELITQETRAYFDEKKRSNAKR